MLICSGEELLEHDQDSAPSNRCNSKPYPPESTLDFDFESRKCLIENENNWENHMADFEARARHVFEAVSFVVRCFGCDV
jgi:hypothetical protein